MRASLDAADLKAGRARMYRLPAFSFLGWLNSRPAPALLAGSFPMTLPRIHRLSITGTEERRSLALVLHDSSQPWVIRTHEHGWTPKGLCGDE